MPVTLCYFPMSQIDTAEECNTKDAKTFEISKSAFKKEERRYDITIGYTNAAEDQTEMKLFLSREVRDKHGNRVKSLCILNALSSTWNVSIKNECNNVLIPPRSLVKDVMIIKIDDFKDEKVTYNIEFKECTAEEIEEQVDAANLEWARHIWISMYISSKHRDAIIRCSDGEMVLHRFALASASPVLKAVFTHGAEACNGVLSLPDMDKQTLEVIARYIYCGITDIKAELCEKVMAAADKYDFARLKCAAEAKMCKLVDANNVIHYYKVAGLYRLENLKKKCFAVIATTDFIETKIFETLDDLDLLKDTVTNGPQRALLQTPATES